MDITVQAFLSLLQELQRGALLQLIEDQCYFWHNVTQVVLTSPILFVYLGKSQANIKSWQGGVAGASVLEDSTSESLPNSET